MAQRIEIDVIEIDKTNSKVFADVESNGSVEQYTFNIIEPVSMNFVKIGKATVSIEGDNIVYFKSLVQGENKSFNKSFAPKFGGYKSNTFQKASNFSQKEKQDESAFGKCKFGFLIEAYKMGKNLEEAEKESEEWAKAAMRVL